MVQRDGRRGDICTNGREVGNNREGMKLRTISRTRTVPVPYHLAPSRQPPREALGFLPIELQSLCYFNLVWSFLVCVVFYLSTLFSLV